MDTTFTEEQIKRQASLTPEQASKEAGIPVADVLNQKSPLTSSVLTGTQSPVVIPTPIPTNTAQAINGQASALVTQSKVQADLEAKQAEAQAKLDESRAEKISLRDRILGVQQSRSTVEDQFKVTEKTQKYNDITARLESSERAQTNELRALDGAGLTDVQKAQRAQEINRRYAFEQADLGLMQSAASRDMLAAQSFADRKIELELEPLKTKLEFQQEFYQENKDAFDEADKRAFENLIKDSEREYKKAEETAKTLQDTKLSLLQTAAAQGAPSTILSAIQSAKTPEDAISSAGQYGGDMLDRQIKQAQLQKLYADIAEKKADGTVMVDQSGKVIVNNKEASRLSKELTSTDAYKAVRKGQDSLQFLDTFEKSLEKFGSTSGVFDPIKNAQLKAEYNATILNLKEFFNLGVLNGPDETILRGIIPDPTNTSNVRKVAQLGTYQPGTAAKAGIENMKKQIETTIDDRYASLSAQYGDYSPESVGSLRDLQRVYIAQKVKLNPNVAQLVEENPDLSYDEIISVIAEQ